MKLRSLILASFAILAASLAPAQQVTVNYNHSQNFAQYHTYAWGNKNTNQIRNSILAQVAKTDIENAMITKGFTKVDESQNPDVILLANGGLKNQTTYTAWGSRGFGGGMGGTTPEQNVEGTLVVDIYDAKEKSLVWRGVAHGTLSKNGDKNQKMVAKAIQKMFKQYPKPS
jgi:hypothetical protein